jgi:hypothetical protein
MRFGDLLGKLIHARGHPDCLPSPVAWGRPMCVSRSHLNPVTLTGVTGLRLDSETKELPAKLVDELSLRNSGQELMSPVWVQPHQAAQGADGGS